jgi:hypothetical protein
LIDQRALANLELEQDADLELDSADLAENMKIAWRDGQRGGRSSVRCSIGR